MVTEFSAIDHVHMAQALRLAERGLATTQPNPRVGCVIAHGERIVGTGWHERAGGPHAEVFALRAAGDEARGATAYVTLEPCAHFGRTPPCADALVAAGVARVVAAAEDPNPRVDGRGFDALRRAGIRVESGLMRDAARELNRGFFSRLERGRPWLRVKLAASLDGRTALASGESKWITGAAARADVQQWRARSSAILTGIGTVLADDPRLTVRVLHFAARDPERAASAVQPADGNPPRPQRAGAAAPGGRPAGAAARSEPSETPATPDKRGVGAITQPESPGAQEGIVAPLRVVLDANLRTPQGAQVLDGAAPTLIVHGPGARPLDDRFEYVERVAIDADAAGRIDLGGVLALLAERGVNELQVEAGATLCGALLAADFVDELLLYVAPLLLGDAGRPLLVLPAPDSVTAARRLRRVDQRMIGDDQRLLYRSDRL